AAVPPGPTEAPVMTGMTRRSVLRLIALPQAMRLSLPPRRNLDIGLLRDLARAGAVAAPVRALRGSRLVATTCLRAPVSVAGGAAGRLAFAYIELVRGTPALTLLFLIYFGLAPLGLVLHAFSAAVVALGLNGAAYLAEVYRSGLASVDKGQREAAVMVGLRR